MGSSRPWVQEVGSGDWGSREWGVGRRRLYTCTERKGRGGGGVVECAGCVASFDKTRLERMRKDKLQVDSRWLRLGKACIEGR